MRLLIAALIIFSASLSNAAVEVDWTYDSQGVPEYKPTALEFYVDGTLFCEDKNAQDVAGVITSVCPAVDPGTHDFSMIVVHGATKTKMSNVVTKEIPAPPPELPPDKEPVILEVRVT